MPRDFKSFSKNYSENKTTDERTKEYEDLIDKYKNMDNNELMSNLFSEASKLKKEGKLDSATLNNLKTTLSPFLNSEQNEMLNGLIRAIDETK